MPKVCSFSLVHLASPLSRDLFQRAIMQSPGIPTPRAKVVGLTKLAVAEKTAVDYARSVGVTGVGPEALKALRALPADKLMYDPQGDQTLDELKQQVFSDKTMTEPARHLADAIAEAGQPVWLYRFSYVPESQRDKLKGTMHGFEIPYTFDIPAALVGDQVTAADKAMVALASAYWVSFAKTGDPNGSGRRQSTIFLRPETWMEARGKSGLDETNSFDPIYPEA
jgi:carboxylesterase type B